jgi:hypothetical protein
LAWYTESFYDKVRANGAREFYFFYNGTQVGHADYIGLYSSNPPTVAANNTDYEMYRQGSIYPVAVVPIGSVKKKTVLLVCTDQNKKWLWQDSVTVVANRVSTFQMN